MKAVILAGGRGTRLAPYTTVLPKPLMPVGGLPILDIVLRQLRHHGYDEVVLAVGYLSSLIRAYLDQSAASTQLALRYSEEREPLGTAGALAMIDGLDEPFLVMNGDLLTTLDFAGLMQFHRRQDAALTIAVTEKRVQVEVGVLGMTHGGEITSYTEKPVNRYPASMGIYVCSPGIRDCMVHGAPLDIPDLVLRLLQKGERVVGYRNDARWLDIGNPKDYEAASIAFDADRALYLPDGA